MEAALGRKITLTRSSNAKDQLAFAALYEEHVDRVYRHVYYLVGSKTEAEDLTAQAFLQAWTAIGRYQDRGKPILSWLLTIAHNLATSRFRRRHQERHLREDIASRDAHTSPEQAYLEKLRRDELTVAILKLKPTERQVILLRFVDNMEYAEVARVLDRSVNAVRVIQYRALRNLRQVMEQQGGEY